MCSSARSLPGCSRRSQGCAASARRRSTSPGLRLGAWTAIGSAGWRLGHRGGHSLVREAGGRAEDIGGGDPLATGDILAGNDDIFRALHSEIVAA
jgi:hypothetical protein